MDPLSHAAALDDLAGSLREQLLAGAGEAPAGADAQAAIRALVEREGALLDPADREELVARVSERSFGLGPLEPLLRDPEVDEIMVNGTGPVWVERAGKVERSAVGFATEAELRHAIERVLAPLGRRVDEAEPLCDARLPDGSRVNVVIPPLALDGPALTIRRFPRRSLGDDELVALGTWPAALRDLLAAAVRARLTILVSGGTGSGKTTTLNVLSSFVGAGERIVTIEDTAELRLQQPHVVRLEARPPTVEGRGEVTIRRLVRNALRMRPDRIVVGEVRGGEALDMLAAMTTGHEGSLSTVHAGSPEEALRRLETLALMAGVGLPHAAVREQVADAIDLVVHQARGSDGTRRVVMVSEVVRVAGGPATRELYRLRAGKPVWRAPLGAALAARLGLGGGASEARGRDRLGRAGRAAIAGAAMTGSAVTPSVLLAGLAGAAAVGGAWEALAAAEQASLPRALSGALARVLAPLRAAGRSGRAPTSAERRRLGAVAAGTLLAGGWLVAGPWAAVALAAGAPWLAGRVVAARRRAWRAELARGAPAVARALGDALAGGHGVRGALAAAASGEGVGGAAGRELASAVHALDLGDPTETVLERLRARAAEPAWDLLVAAILLQRDAGGDLAGLLRTIAVSLEERARVEADARGATAQARFTAWLVVLLPVGAALLAELAQPGFAAGLAGEPLSAALGGVALVLQVAAVLAIRRIAR